jgi:predicted Co/Zn/Cd cation transporter (cation efflux family)
MAPVNGSRKDASAMTEPQKSPVRYSLEVIGAGMLAALAAWALVTALGADLTVGKGTDASHVGVVDVLAAALLAGLAAWWVQRLLTRRGVARWWPFVGTTALSVSVIGPTWLADGAAGVALIAMHFAVGAVLIAGFSRLIPRTC